MTDILTNFARRSAVGAMAVALAACGGGGSTTAPPQSSSAPVFTVQVGSERFKVEATGAAAASLRARMQSGTMGVILGSLAAGDDGVNAPYTWHLVPSTVAAADVAAEVCDGRPSDVQGNLSYWLGTVKSYCPWSAKVVAEQ